MNSIKQVIQYQAYRLVFSQFFGVLMLSLLILILLGKMQAFSFFSGSLIYIVPNLVFVWCVFRFARAQEMVLFLAAFMIGEVFKLILCGILFLVIVKYLPVSLLSVLIGLAGAIVSFWAACLWQFAKTPATNASHR